MFSLFKRLSPFTRRTTAAIALAAAFIGCSQTPNPTATIETTDENGAVATTQAVPVNGLKGDYYDNIDFTGTLKTRYDATINRNWKTAAPITGIAATTYSVRWTGQIQPAFSEEYTFSLTSSGSARLMINGVVLVNNWTEHASKVDTGKVTLQANTKYDIRLEYARNTVQPALLKLEWRSTSRTKQVVPQAKLFTLGSNLAQASSILTEKLKGLGLTFTAGSERAFLGSDELLITAEQSNASNSFLQASINRTSNQVVSLIRFKYTNTDIKIDNLESEKSVTIPNFSSFFNSKGEFLPGKN
jgi:PA14 domain